MAKKRTKKKASVKPKALTDQILGTIFITLAGLLFLAGQKNLGTWGNLLGNFLILLLGKMAFIPSLFAFIWGVLFFFHLTQDKKKTNNYLSGLILASLAVISLFHLASNQPSSLELAYSGKGGGLVGFVLSWPLLKLFGKIGSFLFASSLLLIAIQIMLPFPLKKIMALIKKPIPEKEEKNIQAKKPELPEKKSLFKKTSKLKVNIPQREISSSADEEIFVPLKNDSEEYQDWQYPSLSLLNQPPETEVDTTSPQKNATLIEQCLADFNINVKVVEANCGPRVTQYVVEPEKGVKVSQILSRQKDLSLALASPSVRIEAPIPSRPYLGIEIPNKTFSMVSLRELLESSPFREKQTKSDLIFPVGRDVSAKPVVADLGDMPHLLIAGATGAGKSVCLNSLICSLLFQASPNKVKFILVDPKVVELSVFNEVPHLLSPVITDTYKTLSSLKWALKEMERRYQVLSQSHSRNIKTHNQKTPEQQLPYIIIVIDELADLMLAASSEVEEAICRLAQMARAVGIHLVIATQRPSTDVITGLIKANIPARIAFAVTSQVDSRVILDTGGAEKLLGKGDMLYLPPDLPQPIRLQGPFLSEDEIKRLIHFLKNQGDPEYREEILVQPVQTKGLDTDPSQLQLTDEKIVDAVKVFLNSERASTSLLQRRLSIGYARAARIMDSLQKLGIISEPEGTNPRDVYHHKAKAFLEKISLEF